MRFGTCALLSIVFSTVFFVRESEGAEQKFLNRSIYLPVTFVVCKHLGDAVYYESEQLVSRVPASRVFQFTYYPNLEKLLPAAVQVRVEGRYRDTNEAFVARVAVTPDGFVTADARRPIDTEKNLKKLRHKIDARHERVAPRLACDRFCSRRAHDPTAKESTESDSKSTEDDPSGGVTDTTESSRSERMFPDGKVHLLPGAGHYSPEDAPETGTRLVAEFVEAS